MAGKTVCVPAVARKWLLELSDAEYERVKQGLRVMHMIGKHQGNIPNEDLALMMRQVVSPQDGTAAIAVLNLI